MQACCGMCCVWHLQFSGILSGDDETHQSLVHGRRDGHSFHLDCWHLCFALWVGGVVVAIPTPFGSHLPTPCNLPALAPTTTPAWHFPPTLPCLTCCSFYTTLPFKPRYCPTCTQRDRFGLFWFSPILHALQFLPTCTTTYLYPYAFSAGAPQACRRVPTHPQSLPPALPHNPAPTPPYHHHHLPPFYSTHSLSGKRPASLCSLPTTYHHPATT